MILLLRSPTPNLSKSPHIWTKGVGLKILVEFDYEKVNCDSMESAKYVTVRSTVKKSINLNKTRDLWV